MWHKTILILTLLGSFSQLAISQPSSTLQNRQNEYDRYLRHQARLEKRLNDASQVVYRLKHQPQSVQRDLKLKRILKESQSLADKLNRLRLTIRDKRSQLKKAYRMRLTQTADKDEKQDIKNKLHALKAKTKHTPKQKLNIPQADPLDGKSELEAKADLIDDSRNKLKKQVRTLTIKIARLEHRSKLRKHKRSALNSPFVESNSRRLGKQKSLAPVATNDGPSASPPLGGQDSKENGSFSGDSSLSPNGESSALPTLRTQLDSTIFDIKNFKNLSPKAQLDALKKAREKLRNLNQKLKSRANELRNEAQKRR